MWTSAPRYSTWSPSGQIVFATVDSGSRLSRPCSKTTGCRFSARKTSPASGASVPRSVRMSVDLPQPFGPRRPIRLCGVTRRSRCAKRTFAPYALPIPFASMRRFGFLPDAWKSRRTLCERFRSASSPTSASSAPALWMRACCFVERAFAPRRSHSVSRRSRFLSESSRCASVARRSSFTAEVRRVVAADVEEAVRVPAVELQDAVRDALEEHAVVRHRDRREGRAGEKLLEPEDRVHVEVVRGLVEEEEIGLPHELARERDALLPPARERRDGRLGACGLPSRARAAR